MKVPETLQAEIGKLSHWPFSACLVPGAQEATEQRGIVPVLRQLSSNKENRDSSSRTPDTNRTGPAWELTV